MEKMNLLRTVRVRQHDDSIFEITCPSDLIQEISPSEKCRYFMEEQTFSRSQNVGSQQTKATSLWGLYTTAKWVIATTRFF